MSNQGSKFSVQFLWVAGAWCLAFGLMAWLGLQAPVLNTSVLFTGGQHLLDPTANLFSISFVFMMASSMIGWIVFEKKQAIQVDSNLSQKLRSLLGHIWLLNAAWTYAIHLQAPIIAILFVAVYARQAIEAMKLISKYGALRQVAYQLKWQSGWHVSFALGFTILTLLSYAGSQGRTLPAYIFVAVLAIYWTIAAYYYAQYGNPMTMLAVLCLNIDWLFNSLEAYSLQDWNSVGFILTLLVGLALTGRLVYYQYQQNKTKS